MSSNIRFLNTPQNFFSMHLVILESPYAGQILRNTTYMRRCLRDSLDRGESPIAFHGLYTQPNVLNNFIEEERKRAIQAASAWYSQAHKIVVYVDYDISAGMLAGIALATSLLKPVVYRSIGKNDEIE